MTSYQNLLLLSIGFYTATSHADLRYRVVSIGDLFGGLDYSMPYCINDFGQVTGQSYVTGNNLAPFVWTAATGIQFLPISIACSPYGGLPHDQNDAGTIVGTGGNDGPSYVGARL